MNSLWWTGIANKTLILLISHNFRSILATKRGRKVKTINNHSGPKTYKEVFNAKSFSQLSASVASSSMSCALDCRRVDGCQSFKWTPEDNSCRMGGLTDSVSGEGDSDPVYIETLGSKLNIYFLVFNVNNDLLLIIIVIQMSVLSRRRAERENHSWGKNLKIVTWFSVQRINTNTHEIMRYL